MFLTPDGEPFYGGTYWPPTPRYGRPSFLQVLAGGRKRVARRSATRCSNRARRSSRISPSSAAPRAAGALGPDDLTRVGESLLRLLDPVNGGIGRAPKFPNAPIFRFFWSEFFRRRDPRMRDGRPRPARRAVRGRHLRSSRRRLRALFDRRRMACAAFREDALRQCADPRTARARRMPRRRRRSTRRGRARPSAG